MADLRERWKSERLYAAVYDFGVQTYPVAWMAGRLMWGFDVNHLWKSVGELAKVPGGAAVLDVPCGGGITFRSLPGRSVRYVAADLSPVMLDRARSKARRSRLTQIAFTQADIEALPFPDGTFDVCVTYNGLHCLPDPAAAIAELARVLRPGGTLRGSTLIVGAGRRQDAIFASMRRLGIFGPSGTLHDLKTWLTAANLQNIHLTHNGAVALFTADRP